jgi:tricorn protease interacting factor F2/3
VPLRMKVHRYVLRIRADPGETKFSGSVEVHLDHDGGELALNVKDLKIEACRHAGKPHAFSLAPEQQEVRLAALPKGPVVVELDYTGSFPEQSLMGLYRTDYGEAPALVTQLEPCGARRIFPCVDHPAHKAEFHVTVDAPAGLGVLFNTPRTSERREGDRVLHTFAPTPRMSTYLLFVGIGKFEERSLRHQGVEIIVACPPGKGSQADFALEHGAKVLDFFNSYFEVAYPLPKLHLVAVPNTAVGGMENWGAIAFRERVLLIAPGASQNTRRQALGVIAHEIAHQWFGDLVTMAWWNDLWLNESFATFMDYQATDHLYPDWQVWGDFSAGTSNAQLWDALPSSHPVNVTVNDPDEISSIFDEISYAKGGALLRMIEGYMGAEPFRKGVARYLAKFAYANARGEDLWAALDQESQERVSPILQAWIDRPGYPALTVRPDGGKVVLEQERFLLYSDGEGPSGPWPVPLMVHADGRTERHVMTGARMELPVKDLDSLVVNHGRKGYVRVRYQGELAASVLRRFPTLDARDRWGFLQDTYGFLLAGGVEPSAYLDLLGRLREERDYLVLSEFLNQVGILGAVLHDRPSFRGPARELLAHQVDRLGLAARPGEPAREAILRQGSVGSRVWVDEPFATELAKGFDHLDQLDPSIRNATAIAYARGGGPTEFDRIFARLQASVNDEDKSRFARALGAFRDPSVLEKALGLPFGGEINPTLGIELFTTALANPEARTAMWASLQQMLPVLIQLFGGSGIVPIILQWSIPFVGLDREEEVRKYFAGMDVGEGARGMRKGFELLRVYSGVRRRFA